MTRDPIIDDFIAEGLERLQDLESDIVRLEQGGADRELVARMFRSVHSLKGAAGFLGFAQLERLTHAGESVLSAIREGELEGDARVASLLLALVDAVRSLLARIDAQESEGDADWGELVERLRGVADAQPEPDRDPAAPASPATQEARAREARLPVDVRLLDTLMTLVGELVLCRNRIVQCAGELSSAKLTAAVQRLDALTAELQASVMKTRLQPVARIFGALPRVVRDLAGELGKRILLTTDGGDTELDRTVIEAIKDPITHIIRNACGHGIESPDERVSAGKPPEGRLSLRAFHEAGQVNIEISDDGRGLSLAAIRTEAVRRGVASADSVADLGDAEIVDLIFQPGFSTAREVTSCAGRGVGLDVVRAEIGAVGGTVAVQSAEGAGTTLRIQIPLTLAIVPALSVFVDGHCLAIPRATLTEVVRAGRGGSAGRIERVHDASVYRLRDKLLPILFPRDELGLDTSASAQGEETDMVVLRAGDREFGLVVDRIGDTEEIVIRPFGSELRGLEPYAGAAILGDGTVALVLDVVALAQQAGLATRRSEADPGPRRGDPSPRAGRAAEQRTPLLVFCAQDGGRIALPVRLVARIETFPRSALEHVGDRAVIQYRGGLLPLVELAELLPERRDSPRGQAGDEATLYVIVHSASGRSVGLIVGAILDIVEARLDRRLPPTRSGSLGSIVLEERATELLDPEALHASAAWTSQSGHDAEARACST